jgi:hypothetical protein
MTVSSGQLLQVLLDQGVKGIADLRAADRGESGSTFLATDSSGQASVVKVLPAAEADAAGHLQDLDTTVRRLRERGYPAPQLLGSGYTDGLLFWIQEVLPGTPLDSRAGITDHQGLAPLLPALIRANDAQAGLDAGRLLLSDLVRTTLAVGGDGYCLHATLERDPGTRDLLALLRDTGERHGGDIPDRGDYVHYDFNPANLLSDGTSLTGVIDLNPPVISGDRAFDLATLLFYCYDHDALRDGLRSRLLGLAAPGVAATYLAHIVLRQVEWSIRHYPGATGTQRHLRLARLAVDDLVRLSVLSHRAEAAMDPWHIRRAPAVLVLAGSGDHR